MEIALPANLIDPEPKLNIVCYLLQETEQLRRALESEIANTEVISGISIGVPCIFYKLNLFSQWNIPFPRKACGETQRDAFPHSLTAFLVNVPVETGVPHLGRFKSDTCWHRTSQMPNNIGNNQLN